MKIMNQTLPDEKQGVAKGTVPGCRHLCLYKAPNGDVLAHHLEMTVPVPAHIQMVQKEALTSL